MKRPGKIVQTNSGQIGETFDDEKPIGGKVRVWIDNNGKKYAMLCNPKSLHVIGFID